ncbi:MAG TPA: hypothetical protein VK897_12780 [Anaerolineales bacterium]|nr:hypothetical protein [Anaerolineales bacterium]
MDWRRPADDPEKRNYPLLAVLFAPVTLPVLVFLALSLLLLRALAYGLFLILFAIALILVRQPIILTAIQKEAKLIGTILLDLNTALIRLFLKPLEGNPRTT